MRESLGISGLRVLFEALQNSVKVLKINVLITLELVARELLADPKLMGERLAYCEN